MKGVIVNAILSTKVTVATRRGDTRTSKDNGIG
jgi:hypothetical protein